VVFPREALFRQRRGKSVIFDSVPFYKRFYGPAQLRFITTGAYRRAAVFLCERFCRRFVQRLAKVRQEFSFLLLGWAHMPGHFHLLLKPQPAETSSTGAKTSLRLLPSTGANGEGPHSRPRQVGAKFCRP
jgi:REP element-mobilizing transposase RayT